MDRTALAASPPELRRCDPADTAGMLEAFDQDGFAFIPGVLTAGEVTRTLAEIERLRHFHFDANVDRPRPGTEDWRVDHFKCVFNRSPFWLGLTDRPGVIELAEATMGAECHLIGMTVVRRHPNPSSFGEVDGTLDPANIHSDHLLFPVDEELLVSRRARQPVTVCTAHYYLSDVDLDLAPTWVVPGSHLSGRMAQDIPPAQRTSFRGRPIQPVLCRAGDVLFFRSELWHSASRNRTAAGVRSMLQVHYGHRSMAQRFSPYLDFRFNHEVLAAATPRQRRLLGDHRPAAYD